jgi:hypothetical protein
MVALRYQISYINCTDPLIYFKNKGFTPDTHLYIRKTGGLGKTHAKNIIYTCEHSRKRNAELAPDDIHKYFPQAVHISEREF